MQQDNERLKGISNLLVQENLLDKSTALSAQKEALQESISLQAYLVKKKILSSLQLALCLSKSFGVPILDLDCINLDNIPLDLVNEKLIRQHNILPLFSRSNHLYLAIDDPSLHTTLKEIQFHTALHAIPIVVETDKLKLLIDKLLHNRESEGLADYVDDSPDLEALEINNEDADEAESVQTNKDDAPVVKFVNKILIDAVKSSVSDIHFEPYEKNYRIRYRQDGILKEVASPPVSLSSRITARVKILSNLDISERRVPQDGRFKLKLSKTRSIDFRVSTCPTVNGEKVVMRILDPGSVKLGIESLGFSKAQQSDFLESIKKPQGMILVTGPTGSGKTVTLYTAINILNTDDVNISTAEDPVEIKLAGINQININLKAGLNFSNSLRSFLRQDPDIIMVGEIRDLETAEIAVKASQTGHLVLSTLHTNGAAETLTRLVNMGVPSFNIASSVSLIIAQRLARKLCSHCRELRDDITQASLVEMGFNAEDAESTKVYKAVGCENCTRGYSGRLGLFEVITMSKEIGSIIMSGGNSLDILTQAKKEGFVTIYESGLRKVSEGLTTLEEVNRVSVD